MTRPRSERRFRRTLLWLVPVAATLVGYWALPISGRVIITGDGQTPGLWPRFSLETERTPSGTRATVAVLDVEPWPFVQLTFNGRPAQAEGEAIERAGTWQWRWSFPVPEGPGYSIDFYHSCQTGCQKRGQLQVGTPAPGPAHGSATKLGVVMPSPERNWHGRSGWGVEVAYARHPEDAYWGVDDLASRVADDRAKGLRVLVRVDYEQQQSLPPVDDYVALAEYLAFLRRLARDDRLAQVHGFVIGSDYNAAAASTISPTSLTTPEWYARIYNGYGEDIGHRDNAIQIVHAENPQARVIVGPIRPWVDDQDGAVPFSPCPMAWLNYMNTLLALLDETAQLKARAGIPDAAPDGFDVQAPGNPDAPEMAGTLRSDEPQADLARSGWHGAQAGFRVYQDWASVINSYPTTVGSPIYIVSANTYDRANGIPPAQNYPAGWLTTALDVVNQDPQVRALVWFLDEFPHSDQWDWFSLTEQPGRLVDAAEEFEALLLVTE